MNEYESLSHIRLDCKYYVGFIPKCRRKTLYLVTVVSNGPRASRKKAP
jgi:hypothetical protein